ATAERLDLDLRRVLRHRPTARIKEGGRRGCRRRGEPDVLLAEIHLRFGFRQPFLSLLLGEAGRGAAREKPRHERERRERSTRSHGLGGADAGVSAAVRGDGAPTWMWAPVAAPANAPRNAMNETPALRRNAISAAPSGLSGCTATSRAWW